MIDIIIKEKKENGKVYKIDVEAMGHANFNPGNDIVCSAVSTLFYALGNYVLQKDVDAKCVFEKGYSKIQAEGNLHEAYEMFEGGLRLIKDKYPECIDIH